MDRSFGTDREKVYFRRCREALCICCLEVFVMPSQDEIYSKVSATLVEALNVDEDEITPTSSLQGDLGAESIDFLDIVLRLERDFGIKIPRGELFPDSVFQRDPDLVREGRVTDQGMVELRSRMPYADLDAFDRDRRLSAVP